jgi:hypothetical protein
MSTTVESYKVKKKNGRLITNSKNWDGSGNGYDLCQSTVHLPVKFMLLLLLDYWPQEMSVSILPYIHLKYCALLETC